MPFSITLTPFHPDVRHSCDHPVRMGFSIASRWPPAVPPLSLIQVLQFLDDLQLRYLFTVLTSAFLALASLCVDLADPFRGSFTITPSTSQLECIRSYIRGDCEADEANQRLGLEGVVE